MNSSGTYGFGSILVAIDGSEGAQRAVSAAIELARKYVATLTVLHVVEIPVMPYSSDKPVEIDLTRVDEGTKAEGELVSKAALLAKTMGVKVVQKALRKMGSAVEGITDYAEKNGIDLIVVGTRGMGGVKRLVFGSVASGVVAHAKCSVLVVR
jgi:nucleotide-binding universal stress UspA family protein